jgi:hypothetical protein
MGGISAGFADLGSVNFNNPASFVNKFNVQKEQKTGKMQSGRIVFDAGINLENRTLIAPNTPQRFTGSDVFFNYIQLGIPLRENWGIAFGIRPLSRISYRVNRTERLFDPVSGAPLDSAVTQFNGSGGSFLPSIGTGFSIGRLSAGVNVGYIFGRREISTRRAFINDSVAYYASNSATNSSFGGLYFQGGLQYRIDLKNNKYIRLGASGNWSQTVNGSRDILRQTYVLSPTSGETLQVDSVFEQNDIKGEVTLPANYTFGFVAGDEARDWLFGVDYSINQWSDYRYFGTKDSVQNGWKLSAGGQYRPKAGKGYFSFVAYRAGISFGKDYIRVGNDLPLFALSFGANLPIRVNRMAPNQRNSINLGFEFQKRGTQESVLRENIYRFSVGFSLTDFWFIKRRYD